jgi:tetratricopeptide (TPR) repeat protein
MKTKRYLFAAAILLVLITGQAFYVKPKPGTAYPRKLTYPQSVSMCRSANFLPEDSALHIPALTGWGNYKWKVSTSSDSAQYYYNQGISMYFAFHAVEAVASFRKSLKFDPDFAMGWYGKALSLGPTINEEMSYKAPAEALEAAEKSKALSGNSTALEKDLIDAIQYRYSRDTTKDLNELRNRYAVAMEKVYQKHKSSADAITLYADAMLLLHPWDLYQHDMSPKAWTPRIASVLKEAMVLSPKHPGANHYYIHAIEGSAHPEEANRSAHLLDTLMPSVAHIVHMPSHIYIRTGEYKRGIMVNDYALSGFQKYQKVYAPVANSAGLYLLHALHLQTALGEMAGSYNRAIRSAKEVSETTSASGMLSLKGAMGNFLQFIYAAPVLTHVRFGKWNEVLKTKNTDTLISYDLFLNFARGLAYARTHHGLMAKNEQKALRAGLTDKSLKADPGIYSPAYAVLNVAVPILAGAIAEEEGNLAKAITEYQKAVLAEDRLMYSEPRAWTLPARQYLGNVMLKAGRYSAAEQVYQQDLKVNPDNGWSLTGLALAQKGLRKPVSVNSKLAKAWAIRDTRIERSVF